MIIETASLMGFGKIHRKTIYFGDGLHVVYGENEAGKTTLKTFLVAMLFGLEKKRGQAAKNDEFHKYLPFMGGIYGGSIEFTYKNHMYQVQRNFSENQDVTVFDRESGRRVSENTELSGNLFSMTREGYLQTLCVSQGEIMAGQELASMLRNYLANMSHSKTQDVDVEKAISYLRKEIRREKKNPAYEQKEELRQILDTKKDEEQQIAQLELERDMLEEQYPEEEPKTILWRIIDWIRGLFGFVRQEDLQKKEIDYQIEMIDLKLSQLYESQKKLIGQRKTFDRLKKQIKETESNILAMQRAMEIIKEASEEIHDAFGKEFEERVSTIMEEITDGTYTKVHIDDAMGIVAMKDGTLLDINYLSTGTVEQIYLAVRIAAAELMFPDEIFPVILDDIFGNFDHQRLQRVLNFLQKTNRQVILFTCRKDVLSILEESGCRYEKTVLNKEET
ncbi:MAG: AAA family ATPase [Lachnospiraceae bacterium]|nr:AAA family ATPase [Lachnospiraceae bacterium]